MSPEGGRDQPRGQPNDLSRSGPDLVSGQEGVDLRWAKHLRSEREKTERERERESSASDWK